MFAVLLYIGLYMVWYKRGYQAEDELIGTTSVKVKGTGATNSSSDLDDMVVWTSHDLVFPPVEADALFITTAQLTTTQTRGVCEGNSDTGACATDLDCPVGYFTNLSQGVLTGKCSTNHFCEVKGWCPLETGHPTEVYNVDSFTIFVKVNGRFQEFEEDFTNAKDKLNNSQPVSGYNLFSLNDLVSMSGNDYEHVKQKGAILLFTTRIKCNLDRDKCPDPNYSVQRVDNIHGIINPGFNFRTVSYQLVNETEMQRTLTKHVGVRVLFHLNGVARRLDFLTLSTTVGAGIAFLSIATIICDIVLENFLGDVSAKYERAKNQDLSEEGKMMRTPLSQANYQDLTDRRLTEGEANLQL